MLCPKCSTPNRENAKFCKVCGYSFPGENVSSSSQPAPASEPAQQEVGITNGAGVENSTGGSPDALNVVETQGADGAIEVVAQPEATPVVHVADAPEDDISFAPTQILTQQDMMALQARRWHHDAEQSAATAVPNAEVHSPIEPQSHSSDATTATTDVSDMPTIMMSSAVHAIEEDPMSIPPPPPPESQQPEGNDPTVSSYAEQAAAPPTSVTPTVQEAVTAQAQEPLLVPPVKGGQPESGPVAQSQAAPQVETPVASSALAAGTLLAGRYEIVHVVSEDEREHVYQVADRQGYQHCWNCGSEENAEGDEFCIDCGAELLNASYLLHEYSATAGNTKDEHVINGTIANTFVEQGKTYVVEQQHAAQIAFPNGVHLLAASDSDAGNVRRSEPNEDSTLVLQLQRMHESQATPVGVFIVADGMGGHDNGQGASRMAVNVIAEKLTRELLMPPLVAEKNGGLTSSVQHLEEDTLIGLFKGAIEDANNVLVQTNQHDKTDMGSTITGFMIAGDSAYIINVGDSRTYMLREGTLYQLTNDHSLVGQLVAGGLIEPDDVYTHPQRSQIFRSLGDKMNVQVDDFKQQLLPGDVLISCSDGLWEMVRNPQITDILHNAHDPQSACMQLLDAANANGGEDNVSAVVVFVR